MGLGLLIDFHLQLPAILWLVGLVVGLGLMVWSAIRFFHAPEVREQLLWGGFCFFNVLFISFLKVWFWMEMHSNRVLRELKRVELLLEYNLHTRA